MKTLNESPDNARLLPCGGNYFGSVITLSESGGRQKENEN